MSISKRFGIVEVKEQEESKTKQSFKDQCNINKIVDRFQRTGVLPATQNALPRFMDVPQTDLLSALNLVREAESLFYQVPAQIRKKVNNNPVEFLQFIQNPDNMDTLDECGLLNKEATDRLSAARAAKAAETPPNT